MNDAIVAGVDIGGSHVASALVNIDTSKAVDHTRKRKIIDSGRNSEDILNDWVSVIKESYGAVKMKPQKIGVAMPGPFDYTNGISYIRNQNKYDSLYGLNIKEKACGKIRHCTRPNNFFK